jgi:F-type H+-transporting ATPase subunit gamma
MASAREMRLRIRSIKNIVQVTRALQAVSASKVRKAVQAVSATRAYAEQAWKILVHLSEQPGHNALHPLLKPHQNVKNVLVILITSDRGLAGAYNTNIVRNTLLHFKGFSQNISYITAGKKGRDLLLRRKKSVIAEFSNLPAAPSFTDISPIGRMAVDGFLDGTYDEVYLAYTDFITMIHQDPVIKRLLPFEIQAENQVSDNLGTHKIQSAFTYEPDQGELLNQIIPRFTALQVYRAVLEAQASEHAARMISMQNATDNAMELTGVLQLAYNKVRQQSITNDMLDIAGGAEALSKSIN